MALDEITQRLLFRFGRAVAAVEKMRRISSEIWLLETGQFLCGELP